MRHNILEISLEKIVLTAYGLIKSANEHKIPYRLIVIILLILQSCARADEKKAALCLPDEQVLFSCTLDRRANGEVFEPETKIVKMSRKNMAVCGTKTLSAEAGRITYRFGTDISSVVSKYPNDDQSPEAAFTAETSSWPKGRYWALSFNHGPYTYTIYDGMAVYEASGRENGGGVRTFRSGKLIQDLWCDDSTKTDRILHDYRSDLWRLVSEQMPKSAPAP